MPVLPFIPAIVGAAGAVGGALIGSHAANSAADAQFQASQANNALQEKIYNENTANLSPWMNNGSKASGALASLLGLGGDPSAQQGALSTWRNATGYQDQLKAGVDALNTSAATSGLLHSGANLKNISNYGQTQAQKSLDDYMGQLSGLSGQGLSAGAAVAGVGENYANTTSANNNNAAAAQGNAAYQTGNLWTGALTSASNGLGQAFQNSSYGNGALNAYPQISPISNLTPSPVGAVSSDFSW